MASGDSHWVNWHADYDDPTSRLNVRLRHVQAALVSALGEQPPGPISVISVCAGQGRDVIDVLGGGVGADRTPDVRALLLELDPELVAFARARAEAAGVGDQVTIVEGDASAARMYADAVPAGVVLICGVFGNISADDIHRTIAALPTLCSLGASVIWTRHRRPPDLNPFVRSEFAQAGFEEQSFVAPEGHVLCVGRHRLVAPAAAATPPDPFDPSLRLFDFIGDGEQPA
jgi:predicted RNA methylase